jgi:hypothetical protein
MLKLRELTLISLLLLIVAVGCSSSDQAAIDEAVSATLAAAQPATTNSTELSECVTLIAFLVSEHWHDHGVVIDSYASHPPAGTSLHWLFGEHCGTYIDNELLEKFIALDWVLPPPLPPKFIGENKE